MDFPKSVPGVGLVGGKFVDEDAATGRQGSLIPAIWGNAVTEELLNVIEAAGSDPDEDDSGQLLRSIRFLLNQERDLLLGNGQQWQNVKSSRLVGTTYTNTTGRSICVSFTIRHANALNLGSFRVNGIDVWVDMGAGHIDLGVSLQFVIPAGATYSLNTSDWIVDSWVELR